MGMKSLTLIEFLMQQPTTMSGVKEDVVVNMDETEESGNYLLSSFIDTYKQKLLKQAMSNIKLCAENQPNKAEMVVVKEGLNQLFRDLY